MISGVVSAEASWLLDPWKYHISSHGQTSCLDCHEGQEDRNVHPDPEDVNEKPVAMSVPEDCISCHDNIPEDLDSGLHGEARISDPEEYRNCIDCHGPHDQPLVEAMRDRLDFGKPLRKQCAACHDNEEELPTLTPEDEACMVCHGLPDPEDPERTNKIKGLCLFCHGRQSSRTLKMTQLKAPVVDEKRYQQTSHALTACTDCHFGASRFRHRDQARKACRE